MLVPQRRSELEIFQPEIRNIESDPDLQRRFRQWIESRNQFVGEQKQKGPPEKGASPWQGHYTRGTTPAGERKKRKNDPRMKGMNMNRSLENKVAVVTGGTSGIGKAAALALAEAGAKVVVGGRRESEGKEVVQAIEKIGGKALFVKTDVSREADVKALVDKTLATFGRLDIAFNNAGTEGQILIVAVELFDVLGIGFVAVNEDAPKIRERCVRGGLQRDQN